MEERHPDRDQGRGQRRRVDALMNHLFAGQANRWAAQRQRRIERLACIEEDVAASGLRRVLDEFGGLALREASGRPVDRAMMRGDAPEILGR